MSRSAHSILLCVLLLVPASARAQVPERPGHPPPLTTEGRVISGAATVVPGLLLNGAGLYAAGDRDGGLSLLALQGTGLAAGVGGLAVIALTGASRRTIAPLYALTLSGVGLMAITGAANLYGGAMLLVDPGTPLTELPHLELGLGYRYVHDVRLDVGSVPEISIVARPGDWRMAIDAGLAPASDVLRGRLLAAYRLLGPTARAAEGAEHAYLEIEGALGHHRFGAALFGSSTADLLARGRLPLDRVARGLRGSFGELAAGYGLQVVDYTIAPSDVTEQLLLEFGFGVAIGGAGPVRGEAMIFYDHRKDGWVDGIPGGGGIAGKFGLRSRLHLGQDWGVAGEVVTGGAQMVGVSLIRQFGEVR